MTIKEKAKAYDKAFKIAQELYNDPNSSNVGKGYVYTVFPELKESEDERIRKELIKYFAEGREYLSLIPYNKEQCVAWLEKQGEQKPFDYENANIPQKDFASKVESKFKVGDWITTEDKDVHEDYRICRICKVDNDKYYIENGDFFNKGTLDAYEYHIWNIQDARDGDVLVTDDMIVLFEKRLENNSILTYFHYDTIDDEYEPGCHLYYAHIYPATEKQRDLLFQKMKEAGYEWDAEKKELNKISQRMISAEVKEAMYGKPAWSEEDEEHVNSLLKRLEGLCRKEFAMTRFAINEDEDWLKSLKERIRYKENFNVDLNPFFEELGVEPDSRIAYTFKEAFYKGIDRYLNKKENNPYKE